MNDKQIIKKLTEELEAALAENTKLKEKIESLEEELESTNHELLEFHWQG